MGEMGLDEAYATLMSANPWSQYSGSVGLRNFAAAASATAQYLRTHGRATYAESGSAGVMTQQVAEEHAAWFDQVATNAHSTADQVDALVKSGYQHQTTAESTYAHYKQAAAADSGPAASGADDMNVIHTMQNGTRVLNSAADEWSSSYDGFKPAEPPPPPPSAGSGSGTGTGTSGAGSSGASGRAGSNTAYFSAQKGSSQLVPTSGPVGGDLTGLQTRVPGDGGSIAVGLDGGTFSGWFKDPTTGYYVDPSTGREFDPITSRWIDPVTGQPFGDVTQYATGLQGLGPASTTGGLLADTGSTAGAVGSVGSAGGFAGLFATGNTAAVASGYGGVLPPSLVSGSAASGSLWQQASRSLAVRQQVAGSMLAREEAARTGRPYTPPMQAGLGASAGGNGSRRPSYVVAEEEEAGLFSSRGARARGAAVTAGEEEGLAGANGRRSYLPPAQAGAGKDDKKTGRARPDWVVDDEVFGVEPAPSGVLGE